MHQRIPRWKSICWCSQNWKHCIWISTKVTLQFIWVQLSLAFVVKEGEIYCHIFLKFVRLEKFLCNSFTEGDYWKREKSYWKREKSVGLVFKFHSVMTCCVAINAKEGDCWIQLIIVYCPWCYTNVISDISHLPSSVIQQNTAVSVNRAHSVTKGSR